MVKAPRESARLPNQLQKLSTSKARKPWRRRVKPIKSTPAEKKLKAVQRKVRKKEYHVALEEARASILDRATELHERFGGHSVDYYFEEIMQNGRLVKGSRETSRWNAYLRSEVRKLNDGTYLIYQVVVHLLTCQYPALPDGAARRRASDLAPVIAAQWKQMSKEEQNAATDDLIPELKEHREMKKLAVQNVPINAFHDTQVSLKKIQDEVSFIIATAL